jgi:hypothetical protein
VRYDEEVAWYLDAISRGLPRDGGAAAHPKVAATVRRVVELWQKGEKVVVFCHFRKTGTALRRHVSNAIDAQLRSSVSTAFGVAEHDVLIASSVLPRESTCTSSAVTSSITTSTGTRARSSSGPGASTGSARSRRGLARDRLPAVSGGDP